MTLENVELAEEYYCSVRLQTHSIPSSEEHTDIHKVVVHHGPLWMVSMCILPDVLKEAALGFFFSPQ